MQLLRRLREWGCRFNPLDLVQALRDWECGKPADRVNALLGLIGSHDLDDNMPSTIAPYIQLAIAVGKAVDKSAVDLDDAAVFIDGVLLAVVDDGLVRAAHFVAEGRLGAHELDGPVDGLNSNNGIRLRYMPWWLPNFHAPKHMFSFIKGVPNNPRTS